MKFLFLCVLNHLIHTPLQETGAIINPFFTNEEVEVQSLNNMQEVTLNHNLDPDSMVPSDFTLNHYSTLPLKNSELSRKGSFFTGWPLLKRNNQQGAMLLFIYFTNIITYNGTYIPAVYSVSIFQ